MFSSSVEAAVAAAVIHIIMVAAVVPVVVLPKQINHLILDLILLQ